MTKVLVVDDEPQIVRALRINLSARGYQVITAHDGTAALRAAAEGKPDVVVLDLGLPDIDGADVLRMLRAVSAVPVVIATARDDEAEIVRLLNAGADDYVVKPYSVDHLEARLRALLRRAAAPARDPVLEVGDLKIDTMSREVTLAGEPVELARKEFDLIALLASRAGEVVSKRELLAEVWRQPFGGADKTVDVHLSWLRRKLGETAEEPRYLHTVRGVGVKLVAPTD